MQKRLTTYLQYGNRFCGIEHTSKKSEDIIHATLLKKTKSEVDIEACFLEKSIKNIAGKLPKNQHVYLVINDDQVLTKSLKNEQNEGINLVNNAFPNINISDFYFEIIHQDKISFISICRKEYIDKLINKYYDNNIHVISFSLGHSILSNTINYIENGSIFTSNANVLTDNNFIKTIDYVEQMQHEEDYNINGLNISSLYLLSLSGALLGFLNNFASTINYQDKKSSLLNTYNQTRFFNQFLKIGLAFILGVLLINFLFFNFYYNQVNSLSEISQLNQTTKTNIIKLKEQVNKAQKTTEDLLKSNASKSSFYTNAIVNSLPNSILLSDINYQSLKKNIKPDKPIELNLNTIIVSGESNNSSQYSEWIVFLENMSWVEKVTVETYNDSKSLTSSFSIKINIIP